MHKHVRPGGKLLPRGLSILYEDRDILVVDKPAGLLTIATDREKTRTAYYILTDYVRKGYSKSPNRIFIVHRLDRETSGILVFAKSIEAKLSLQNQWKTTEKRYLAVVHGACDREAGTITTLLAENKAHFVYSTSDSRIGKLSQTAYKVLKRAMGFSLLEVRLLTGRKHQIRVHLAGIGHAVVGDPKYGKEDGSHARMALHALSLSFQHPFSGKQVAFEAKVPAYFTRLVGGMDRGGAAKGNDESLSRQQK
ncbi:MAG TPA: RluA family pseudouridine synthase [Verrucomicrobiae bacterium]|jgi:tRNA pseudouridine32 synthase/23S rRNA pseudouridine746 synthase/23S rRNA pseudouridine1911/1915/1917 synthase|nr:RluA family pseudouridine synthase [Verrucomicrobiae bacterium]